MKSFARGQAFGRMGSRLARITDNNEGEASKAIAITVCKAYNLSRSFTFELSTFGIHEGIDTTVTAKYDTTTPSGIYDMQNILISQPS